MKIKVTRLAVAAIFAASFAMIFSVKVLSDGVKLTVNDISAVSAILIEADSGDTVFDKSADTRLPMASTTKIMTAIVAIESGDVDRNVQIAPEAVGVEGSSIYLKHGESLTLRELLYALMLASANDAAAAIAYDVAGGIDEFAELMNVKAKSLGLTDTHFTNPHGLNSAEHYTTARELAVITAYAIKNELFREIVSTKTYKITSPNEGEIRVLVNHNKLLRSYDGAVGVKTGYTMDSGRCLVSSAERDNVIMIAVTLDAPNDWSDHKKLLDFGFEKYESQALAEEGQFYCDVPCIGGNKSYVSCTNKETLRITLPKGTTVAARIEADRYFPAPVKKGDAIASVKFFCYGREIARIPLLAEYDVAEGRTKLTFFEKILQLFGR